MRTTPPLTRNLEGLQVGAADRIASIAKHYPAPLLLEHPDPYAPRPPTALPPKVRLHAHNAVLWAIEIIRAAEAAAAEIPPTGAGIGPDMGGE